MPFQHTLTVRFSDCDMFRHVNNAVYLTFFEEARAEYWRAMLGPDFTAFGFILAESTVSYRSPALYGETLDIAVWVPKVGNKSFEFAYRLTERQSGREVATGRSIQVMYDYERQATLPVPDVLRERIAAFDARMAQDRLSPA